MRTTRVFVWMSIGSIIYFVVAAAVLYVTKDMKKNAIRSFIATEQSMIESLSQDPAVREQLLLLNAQNKNLNAETILKKDELWIHAQEQNPLIQTYLNNKMSRVLSDLQKVRPEFKEIFVTDQYGLIAGLTNKTSDYYQADEDWWIKTSTQGSYVGEIEFDESSRCWAYPIFYAVRDAQGNLLGVIKAVLDIAAVI